MSRWNDVTRAAFLLACVSVLALQGACGRGGGHSEATPTPTPIPTAPPTQVVSVGSGGNIGDIAKGYPDGVLVNVSTGSYPPVVFERGDFNGPVTLVADTSEGPVLINGRGHDAAIDMEGIDQIDIDGFEIIGGNVAVIRAIDSVDVIVENNLLYLSGGNGLRFETCAGVLVFDNLIVENQAAGIAALGQNTIEIINNTIYGNGGDGVMVRRLQVPGDNIPSAFAFLQNNIIDGNTGNGVFIDQFSDTGNELRYNINNNGYRGVSAGYRDLTANPLFIAPSRRNFRMQVATGSGGSPAFDRGDPSTEEFFLSTLETRTTRPDSFLDNRPPDLGYHYPNGIFSPTPIPTHTPTGVIPATARPTNTRPVLSTSTPIPASPTRTPTPTPTGGGSGVVPTATATSSPAA